MTPHIEAKLEDISNIVIMPGDPKRVEYIVKNFLEDYVLVNEVRGCLGYTGYYKGKKITVFASGMGIPSMGIYSHELYKFYNVETIIRIGSAGSYTKELNVNDLFLVTSSYSESNYAMNYCKSNIKTVNPSQEINNKIKETSLELNINLKEGKCHSTESFYTKEFDIEDFVNNTNCKCTEMETYSLFTNAKELNKNASCILTISDSLITNESLSSKERETNFNNMIKLVLETTLKL